MPPQSRPTVLPRCRAFVAKCDVPLREGPIIGRRCGFLQHTSTHHGPTNNAFAPPRERSHTRRVQIDCDMTAHCQDTHRHTFERAQYTGDHLHKLSSQAHAIRGHHKHKLSLHEHRCHTEQSAETNPVQSLPFSSGSTSLTLSLSVSCRVAMNVAAI